MEHRCDALLSSPLPTWCGPFGATSGRPRPPRTPSAAPAPITLLHAVLPVLPVGSPAHEKKGGKKRGTKERIPAHRQESPKCRGDKGQRQRLPERRNGRKRRWAKRFRPPPLPVSRRIPLHWGTRRAPGTVMGCLSFFSPFFILCEQVRGAAQKKEG